MKLLSSDTSEQRKSSTSSSSVSAVKGSMQIHAKAVLWIAVEDGCLEPLHSLALPVSTSREVPLARREVLQPQQPQRPLQSRADGPDAVLEAVTSKEPDRPQNFIHEQPLVHPRHVLHSQPHSRLHPHSHSSLRPIPQIFLPTPAFNGQTPQMSHLSLLPPAFPFIHLPQSTKSPQFPSTHPLHYAALSNQMPYSQSVRAPFPLPPQTQRPQMNNLEQELPTQHHSQSLLVPATLPSPRPPPLIYSTQEMVSSTSPYDHHHLLHRHSSTLSVPLPHYNDKNINNSNNNNNTDSTTNSNNNDNNHSSKEDRSHTNGHKYYNNPAYPFTTSANNHNNCDLHSINVPQNGQANLVQGHSAMTMTHPMLQIRNPAIPQQQLQYSNYISPNLQRVIPTFPAPHQSLPVPSPNLQTFRLLPGGQLRKNSSSLNPKIL